MSSSEPAALPLSPGATDEEEADTRLGALDGKISVDSAPGAGTRVVGRIPLPDGSAIGREDRAREETLR